MHNDQDIYLSGFVERMVVDINAVSVDVAFVYGNNQVAIPLSVKIIFRSDARRRSINIVVAADMMDFMVNYIISHFNSLHHALSVVFSNWTAS